MKILCPALLSTILAVSTVHAAPGITLVPGQSAPATGFYAESVQVPARSRTMPAITMERIADFDARVLCYRLAGTATLSCVPFSQVNSLVISELLQRAAESQR